MREKIPVQWFHLRDSSTWGEHRNTKRRIEEYRKHKSTLPSLFFPQAWAAQGRQGHSPCERIEWNEHLTSPWTPEQACPHQTDSCGHRQPPTDSHKLRPLTYTGACQLPYPWVAPVPPTHVAWGSCQASSNLESQLPPSCQPLQPWAVPRVPGGSYDTRELIVKEMFMKNT